MAKPRCTLTATLNARPGNARVQHRPAVHHGSHPHHMHLSTPDRHLGHHAYQRPEGVGKRHALGGAPGERAPPTTQHRQAVQQAQGIGVAR